MNWGEYWKRKEAKWRKGEDDMFIPQEHIREILGEDPEIEELEMPFVVELWENGNYNEYGGDVGDLEVYP